MKKIAAILIFILIFANLHAQKYITQNGNIRFYSKTALENIEAVNNQVSGVLNLDNGELAFTLLMKAFTFEKALMQEHFNEKYVESHKYPRASFKGSIQNFRKTDIGDKPLRVSIRGMLTMHGVGKEIEITGTLQRNAKSNISGKSVFYVNPKDFKIKIPATVRNNISDKIQITVNVEYEKMD